MQCYRVLTRSACSSRNAYNPSSALRAAFVTIPRLPDEQPVQRDGNEKGQQSRIVPSAAVLPDEQPVQEDDNGKDQQGQTVPSLAVLLEEEIAQRDDGDRAIPSQQHSQSSFDSDHGPSEAASLEPTSATYKEAVRSRIAAIRLRAIGMRQSPRAIPRDAEAIVRLKEFFEYTSRNISPDSVSSLPPSWTVRNEHPSMVKSGPTVLTMEIKRFAKSMQMTPLEKIGRQTVASNTIAFVKANCGSEPLNCTVFGSEKTGLALPYSDIDIRLEFPSAMESQHEMRYRVSKLFRKFRGSKTYTNCELRRGMAPIIACTHRESGIAVQVVVNRDSTPQQEATSKYLAEFPQLRALFTVFHTFYSMRSLLQVFSGGLGSYGVLISLVAALKDSSKSATAGEQFFRILRFYADLDTRTRGVAVHPRPFFLKHDDDPKYHDHYSKLAHKRGDPVRAGQWTIGTRNEFIPYLLCLQDPVNPTNDLGRKAYAIKLILATLKAQNIKLQERMQEITDKPYDVKPYWILPDFLGPCEEHYAPQRRKLNAYGHKVYRSKQNPGLVQGSNQTLRRIWVGPGDSVDRGRVRNRTPERAPEPELEHPEIWDGDDDGSLGKEGDREGFFVGNDLGEVVAPGTQSKPYFENLGGGDDGPLSDEVVRNMFSADKGLDPAAKPAPELKDTSEIEGPGDRDDKPSSNEADRDVPVTVEKSDDTHQAAESSKPIGTE